MSSYLETTACKMSWYKKKLLVDFCHDNEFVVIIYSKDMTKPLLPEAALCSFSLKFCGASADLLWRSGWTASFKTNDVSCKAGLCIWKWVCQWGHSSVVTAPTLQLVFWITLTKGGRGGYHWRRWGLIYSAASPLRWVLVCLATGTCAGASVP